jgi:hypothetical protein
MSSRLIDVDAHMIDAQFMTKIIYTLPPSYRNCIFVKLNEYNIH